MFSSTKLNELLNKIDKQQKQINEMRPLPPNMAKQLRQYYRVSFTYTSNALEGNSLTETETKIVLEDGITIGGKPLNDHYEAAGHSDAYDYIYKLLKTKEITEKNIKYLHKLFYNRVNKNCAGCYRRCEVIITGSDQKLPKPEKISGLMSKFAGNIKNLEKENHPVVYAAKLHKELVYIHPFTDGNGRVSRLLMNLALMQHNYLIAIIPPILRSEYIQAIRRAEHDENDFIKLVAQCVKETQNDYLRMLS